MARPARPGVREALLEAARAEFARSGLERARVEDIARRAGVSKGAFYLHFPTKESAFEAIVQRFFGAVEELARRREEAEERFAADAAGTSDPALAARQLELECILDADLLDTFWRNRQLLAALDAAGLRYAALMTDFRRRMRDYSVARIAAKQADGRLRADVDPEVVGDVLVGTYEGIARRMVHLRERPDLLAWTRSFLRIVYEGIQAPAHAAAPRVPRSLRRPRAAASLTRRS